MSRQWFRNTCRVLSIVSCSVFMFSACTQEHVGPNDAKSKLNEYITKSFSAKSPQDREVLMNYLTGEAKSRLQAWSDDQFREAFIDTKRQFQKLAFKEVKNMSPSETQITYELSYLDLDKKGSSFKVTNKKMAELVNDSGNWYIRDVHNIKELVEYQNEMSLP
jgi:hypothetical protein